MSGATVRVSPRAALPSGQLGLRWVVLVAVVAGVMFGAFACAAGLAGGAAHGAADPPLTIATDRPAAEHGDHADHADYADHAGHAEHDAAADSAPHSVPPGSHGDHSGHDAASGGHPGMACVVSVDLRFPPMSSPTAVGLVEVRPVAMAASCPADVEPPVPRSS